jgi:CheY-like chemotaxis protein
MSAAPVSAAPSVRVAFLGFSDDERQMLAAGFRRSDDRGARYELVCNLTDAHLLVADADHGPSVQLVEVTERLSETLFIGAVAPPGAGPALRRPIDALHVLVALEQLRSRRSAPPRPALRGADPGLIVRGMQRALIPRQAPVAARAPSGPELVGPPAPPRVLLVDDSRIALRYLANCLAPWGVRADLAGDSAAALSLLAQVRYALLFLDVELGAHSEMDGLALCRHIKQQGLAPESTLVMVSAYQSQIDRARGALAGCEGYLGKPLKDPEMAALLQRHGLRRGLEVAASNAGGRRVPEASSP